ncbi:MAG: LiaF domain-containing protein [Actinomycetota bacterium]
MLLLLAGLLWLFSSLGVEVPWHAVLPAALIAIGAALIASSRRRHHGGLVVIGVIITIVLAITAGGHVSMEGGSGERTDRPATLEELQPSYRLAFGTLTVDLRELSLPPGTTSLKASVGMGTLVVYLPMGAAVRVEGHAGIGNVELLGRKRSGIGAEDRFTAADYYTGAESRLRLEVSVGMGSVEVRR